MRRYEDALRAKPLIETTGPTTEALPRLLIAIPPPEAAALANAIQALREVHHLQGGPGESAAWQHASVVLNALDSFVSSPNSKKTTGERA